MSRLDNLHLSYFKLLVFTEGHLIVFPLLKKDLLSSIKLSLPAVHILNEYSSGRLNHLHQEILTTEL